MGPEKDPKIPSPIGPKFGSEAPEKLLKKINKNKTRNCFILENTGPNK
jgi:hypothetical protein